MEEEKKNSFNFNKEKIKEKIKEKKEELKKQIEQLPETLQQVNDGLLRVASFNSVMIEELEDYLLENGIKEAYVNGKNQVGYKERVEFKVYNTMNKNYLSIMRTMNKLLSDTKPKEIDELDDFDKDYEQ